MAQEPPNDRDAERVVLGALLSGAALADAQPLASAMFYRQQFALIFEAIVALDADGRPYDPIAVGNELERRGQLGRMGGKGKTILHDCMESCPAPAQVGYYAGIVRDKARRRRLIEVSSRLHQVALAPDEDLAEAVSNISNNALLEITDSLTWGSNGSNGSYTVRYDLRDGAWLDSQQFDPLRYVIPGLMPAGLGIIAAPPKAGKSLLILDWLLAVATGGPALGILPAGPARDVLYLALEDGDRRLQARCRHLLAPGDQIPERFRYILAVPPGQVLNVIGDALSKHPDTGLIVLDTLGRIMPLPGPGETTYQRDYRIAAALKHIADEHPGLAIVVIHHTRKAFSDDFIDSISGTHGLAGAADTIITLTRGRGRDAGVLQVTGRDVTEAGYAVTFHNGVWALDGKTLPEARANVMRRDDETALSGKSAEIIDFIRQQPEGAKASEVTAKFGEEAATYLTRLTKSERLVRVKRGLYKVSEASEASEPQVTAGAEANTGLLEVSETNAPNTSYKSLFVASPGEPEPDEAEGCDG